MRTQVPHSGALYTITLVRTPPDGPLKMDPARKKDDKTGNYNLSMYEDELIKENGKWVFLKRTYHTIYQEAPDYRGLIQNLPTSK